MWGHDIAQGGSCRGDVDNGKIPLGLDLFFGRSKEQIECIDLR